MKMSSVFVVWGEHPGEDTGYYLGAADCDAGAVVLALGAIAERVGDDWSDYPEEEVTHLRGLIEANKLDDALSYWNEVMSSFIVDIEEVSFYTEATLPLEFQWPEA